MRYKHPHVEYLKRKTGVIDPPDTQGNNQNPAIRWVKFTLSNTPRSGSVFNDRRRQRASKSTANRRRAVPDPVLADSTRGTVQ